jgi:SAM-dependent methyltransferase
MDQLDRRLGRSVFGGDPAAYDAIRPDYPEAIYETLRARCGLGAGCRAFEVGAGTGIATRRLLAAGAIVDAFEPDPRLAAYLRGSNPGDRLTVHVEAFEDATAAGPYDLGLAATSFHWVEARAGLAQAARLLRPGGWWAMTWNNFGDRARHDAFHEATVGLLGESRSPSAGRGPLTYGEDAAARRADLEATGAFADIAYEAVRWTLVLDPAGVRALYGTYSEINAREPQDRERLLDQLAEIAERTFGGRVERNMVTALHTARRTGG